MFGGMHIAARQAYASAGKLFKLHLDLLYQCDLDCEHCYLDDKKRKILPTDFWKGVIDQAADLGVFSIIMSGGEIFLRKDLLELVAHARGRGLFVHLKTHGGHIDATVAATLNTLGVSSVALSYYATDAAIHDAITRRPGSHAATRSALVHLAQAGLITVASCVVMQRNRAHWRDVIAECDALGVITSVDGQIQSALSGDRFPHALALDLADAIAIERHHMEGDTDCGTPDASDGSLSIERPAAWGDKKNCGAGHTSLYVSPEGDVTPCVMWPMPLANLNTTRLSEIWSTNARLSGVRALRQHDRELCGTCEVREHCEFCAGQSWVETKTPTAALQHFCHKTRAKTLARAAALNLPEPPMPAGLRLRTAAEGDTTGLRTAAEGAAALSPGKPRFVVRAAP